ncbi:hypothetical protein EIN_485520 [Entamoeba invadens IP1]|uniref:CCHC-type domain-containing protein n=1 Tax=Entamoeba invadens IP1 TaxID=370355 RepID=A0A0A1U7V4_ENTIV|nr:hypothetical protein EIN_485520 [Entamoeba invadens IP1]ELP89160.1 hypothetical protein EIN_485520 [Entamoeba invadens IP1]|eukprot:XP_004255931.1 hypothetical protein EIN_485520 [Entamoeba invadens IP1]
MSVFYFNHRSFGDYLRCEIAKPSITLLDVKQKVVDVFLHRQPPETYQPSQILVYQGSLEITNLAEIIPQDSRFTVFTRTQETSKVTREAVDLKDICVDNKTITATPLFSTNSRKQKPQHLPPGYICRRCGKPGHFIRDCPENNNPVYDRKETAGLPREMYEEVNDDDTNAMITKDGKHVALKITGQQFRPVVQVEVGEEESANSVPKRLRCPKCSGLLRGASVLKCCGKSFCEDCLVKIRSEERCINCGKAIDISKDIMEDKKVRQDILKFFEETNRKIAQKAMEKAHLEHPTKNANEEKSKIKEVVESKPVIEKMDISGLFKKKDPKFCPLWRLAAVKCDGVKFTGKLIGIEEYKPDRVAKILEGVKKRERSRSRERSDNK